MLSGYSPAYRTRAINYFLLAPPFASAVATSSGVFIVNEYSFSVLLLACTGLSICAFLLFWKLKGREVVKTVENVPVKNKLFFEPKILAPAVLSFLNAFSWGGLTAFFPLYAIQCGVKNPGFFFSAMAVMLITSRLLGGKLFDIYSKERIITTTILIMIAAVVLIAFSKTLPLFILAGFIWGAGFGLVFPVAMAYSLEYAGSSDGTTVATYQAFMDSGIALGPVIMGFIIPLTGYRIMFLSLVFICFVNLCYFQFFLKKRHRHTLETTPHL
jgi:MFS family permease